jgi:hypothetical protein
MFVVTVRSFLLAAASRISPVFCQALGLVTAFVPSHRCGAVPDLHRIPSCPVTRPLDSHLPEDLSRPYCSKNHVTDQQHH